MPNDYEVTFRRDGTACYGGLFSNSKIGHYEGSVGLEDYRRIAGLIKAIHFFALPSDQGLSDVIFSPSAFVQVTYQDKTKPDKTKTVYRDYREVSTELWGLEAAIDGISSKINWQKVEDKAK